MRDLEHAEPVVCHLQDPQHSLSDTFEADIACTYTSPLTHIWPEQKCHPWPRTARVRDLEMVKESWCSEPQETAPNPGSDVPSKGPSNK